MSNFLFLNNALSGTGGARVILNLAKALIERNNEVSILLDRADNIEYYIDPRINIFVRSGFKIKRVQHINGTKKNKPYSQFKTNDNFSRNFKLYLKKIRNYFDFVMIPFQVRAYNKFVSSGYNLVVNNNIYLNLDRIYFESRLTENYYVNFHNSPVEVFQRKNFSTVLPLKTIFSRTSLLAVSKGIALELSRMPDFNKHLVETIYNPFNFGLIQEKSFIGDKAGLPENYIITVSTLTERKRIERVIKTLPEIIASQKNIKLLILGEGHLRDELATLVNSLALTEQVVFLGFQSNPYFYIANARLLMLTSDSEGLPTVIIEALALGTPVVSTDCPTGPNEILSTWGNDCLVDISQGRDEVDVINELSRKALIMLQGEYSRDYVRYRSDLNRFDDSVIAQKWEKLI